MAARSEVQGTIVVLVTCPSQEVGEQVGRSLVEPDRIETARRVLDVARASRWPEYRGAASRTITGTTDA